MLKGIIQIIAWVVLLACIFVWLSANDNYNQTVDRHLRAAAAAQRIEDMQAHLDTAVTNIQNRGLTQGSTLNFVAPQGVSDSNVTCWYQDIAKTQQMAGWLANSVRGRATSLTVEQSDSLLAQMDVFFRAARITKEEAYAPRFISIFPNQAAVIILGVIAIVFLFITGGISIFSRT